MNIRYRALLGSALCVFTMPMAAQAQTGSTAPAATPATKAQADGVEDIIVTAQRREERLQDVPIAITAVSAERLARNNIVNSTDLGTVTPALSVAASENYFQPRIRGIGSQAFGPGLENPIATYIDGVYIASAPASLLTLSGVDRIEVLKGPQGTLFGRNATGGLIQVVTKEPTPGFQGNADISYGNYDSATANAFISGGSDTLSANAAIHYGHQGKGYGRDFFLNTDINRMDDEIAARGEILVKPGVNTTIRLSADYSYFTGSYPTLRQYSKEVPLFGPPTPGDAWDSDIDFLPNYKYTGGGVSARVQQDLSFLRLISITAYRDSTYDYRVDYDGTRTSAYEITNRQTDKQFSQELQVTSLPGSRVTWLAGGYYFFGKGAFTPDDVAFKGPLLTPAAPTFPVSLIRIDGSQRTRSYAGFGQATVPLAGFNLTGGLRYTSEKRELDDLQTVFLLNGAQIPLAVQTSKRFSKLTWRFSVDRKLTPAILAYASYNRGFKSGGFNVTTPLQPEYAPETLDAYEAGFKADLFGRKVRVNPSFFYYDYSNIQVQFYTPQGQIAIQSGPSAKIYGGDIDFEIVPTARFRVYGGATLLHDRFGTYLNAPRSIPLATGGNVLTVGDATDNKLPFTPTFSGNIGAEYRLPLGRNTLSFNANLYHNSGYFTEADNRLRQASFEQLSASIGWSLPNDALTIRAWAKNLTNEAVAIQLSAGPVGTGATYQPPRTYGVTIGTKF